MSKPINMLQIPCEDVDEISREFLSLINVEELKSRLRRTLTMFNDRDSVSLSELWDFSIKLGVALVLGLENNTWCRDLKSLTQFYPYHIFFMRFFIQIQKTEDEAERKNNYGKMLKALSKDTDSLEFFHELFAFQSWRYLGLDARAIDTDDPTKKSCDFEIKTLGYKFVSEVKTINFDGNRINSLTKLSMEIATSIDDQALKPIVWNIHAPDMSEKTLTKILTVIKKAKCSCETSPLVEGEISIYRSAKTKKLDDHFADSSRMLFEANHFIEVENEIGPVAQGCPVYLIDDPNDVNTLIFSFDAKKEADRIAKKLWKSVASKLEPNQLCAVQIFINGMLGVAEDQSHQEIGERIKSHPLFRALFERFNAHLQEEPRVFMVTVSPTAIAGQLENRKIFNIGSKHLSLYGASSGKDGKRLFNRILKKDNRMRVAQGEKPYKV